MRTILDVVFLVLFLIISLPIQGILWFIRKFNRSAADMASLHIVNWAFKVVAFFAGVKPKVDGLENIPSDQPVLYVGNHLGFFDVILTYPLMKRRTGYISKKEFEKIPSLSTWMKRLYCLFLDRENPKEGLKTILTAIDYIKDGISIFVFPEGTRSRDGELHEFKAGAFKMATKTGCPIVPVAITGTNAVFEDHFPWIKKHPVQITFGEPIILDELDAENKKHISEYTHSVIAEMLKEQRK